jgi:AcrR family transcriptional regulator
VSRTKRSERALEATRADILAAAGRVFAERGAGATMQAIADEAGYTVPTLYAYFPNKRALLDGMTEAVTCAVLDLYEARMPSGLTFAQKVESLLLRQFGWVQQNRERILVLFNIPEFRDGHAEKPRPFVERAVTWLQTHASSEELGGLDPEHAAWLFWGLGHGAIHRWLHDGARDDLLAAVPIVARIFVQGLEVRR